ncbi:hypothetical protein QVN91_03245 [Bacteroides caecigallinarum]|nr:hypothetical protein [Bacteroides caecigallinarum]
MATKTFEELKQMAIQIRDEKANKQNTATRIGTQMVEHLNKLEQEYYNKENIDEQKKQTDAKFSELKTNIGNVNKIFNIAGEHSSLNDRIFFPEPIKLCKIRINNISSNISPSDPLHLFAYNENGDTSVWDAYTNIDKDVYMQSNEYVYSIGVYSSTSTLNGELEILISGVLGSFSLGAENENRKIRFNRYNSIYISDIEPDTLTSTSNNVVVRFLEDNILFYQKEEIQIPAGTEFVIPNSQYLLYDILNKEIIISNEPHDNTTHILLVNSHRGVPIGGWLADMVKTRKLLRGAMNTNIGIRLNRYDNFDVSTVWNTELTSGQNVVIKFHIANKLFYLTDEIDIPAGTEYTIPHNYYLYYDIYAKEIIISDKRKDNCDFLLLGNSHRGVLIDGYFADIYNCRKLNKLDYGEKIYYQGERIDPKNVAYKNLLCSWNSDILLESQGMDIINDNIIAQGSGDFFSGDEKIREASIAFYDIDARTPISVLKITTDSLSNHINSLCAGKIKDNNKYPLLYATEGYDKHRCFVLQPNDDLSEIKIVQTIELLDNQNFVDWILDLENGYLYAKELIDEELGTCKMYRFDIPDVNQSSVQLNKEAAIKEITLPNLPVGQGAKIYNNKLYYVSGNGSTIKSVLSVIDIEAETPKIISQMDFGNGEGEDVAAYKEGYVMVNNATKPSYWYFKL